MLHIICIIFIVSPPLYSPVDPETAADDTVEYDDYVDDQSLATELPGKQSPSPLPDITYLSILNSCIRHGCYYYYSYSTALPVFVALYYCTLPLSYAALVMLFISCPYAVVRLLCLVIRP